MSFLHIPVVFAFVATFASAIPFYVGSGFSRTLTNPPEGGSHEDSIAQDSSQAGVLPPARAGLQPVPLPRLETLEAPVAEQLRAAQREVQLATSNGLGGRELADVYGSWGQVFHAYEVFESAEAAYINAARLVSGDVRWPHLLGYLYQQTGRLEEAADQFAAVRRMQPDHREATVHLGEVYLRLNRLSEAREQFQHVLETFPAVAHHGLGEVALRQGRFEEAIAHFRFVLERVPQATAVHYPLAMAYRGLGRLDEARTHLQRQGPGGVRAADSVVDRLQTLVRGERALVIQGRRAYEAGQFRDAADAFRKAVNAAPESATSRANLGLALSQLGDAAGSREQFEAALRLEPDNLVAHTSLGMLFARRGLAREAVDHLRAAFDLAPEDVNVRDELLRTLVRLGRDADAVIVLERARLVDPDEEGTVVSLSILLADQTRYREAVALLDEANGRFPERAATATTLARLLAASPDRSIRDGRRAFDVATAVYASSPTPAHGETVALALAELGRCDEASEWMRRAVADAGRAKDAAEVARLEGELPKYATAACRPPGQ